ncbi:MAG TPA: hypothetical protein VFL80_03340, partial [Thermoanaerobaculia bacterium]|nr:hypothetical protein [Thermoanaerobaculia bacterium]
MKLRTQLVLAALILAIAPLTAIVFYTYHSSRLALESAYRSEAARMTRQMNGRLALIRQEIESSLAGVTALPLQDIPRSNSNPTLVEGIVAAMGESASLVDALEFQPAPPASPVAPAGSDDKAQSASGSSSPQVASAPRAPDADPDPDPDEDRDEDSDEEDSPARAASHPGQAARAGRGVAVGRIAIPTAGEPVVIDLPAFPRFERSDEERMKLEEIRALSRRVGS